MQKKRRFISTLSAIVLALFTATASADPIIHRHDLKFEGHRVGLLRR